MDDIIRQASNMFAVIVYIEGCGVLITKDFLFMLLKKVKLFVQLEILET